VPAVTWRVLLIALLVACVVAAAGAVGYASGKSSGPSLSAARDSGERAGQSAGARRGERVGYARGFEEGHDAGYRTSYKRAYRAAYRKALKTPPAQIASAPASAAPPPMDCPTTGAEPNISNLSVRYMTCGQAQGVIATFGSISQHFTVLGFDCNRLSGGDLGGTWRCTKGERAMRFDFGD
jgi:hypothetical protein